MELDQPCVSHVPKLEEKIIPLSCAFFPFDGRNNNLYNICSFQAFGNKWPLNKNLKVELEKKKVIHFARALNI